MAQIDEKQIEQIVSQVLSTLQQDKTVTPPSPTVTTVSSRSGVFSTVEEAIAAAKTAQTDLIKLGFAKRREIIDAIKQVSLENAKRLAELAVQETKMGNPEHKVMKNEGAVNLSPGMEDLISESISGDNGTLLIEYVPYGIINSITPTTNPTSTVINHAIIMIAAGNAVIFSPHPNARDCTEETMHIINEAIVKAGGPANLLASVANATLRTAKEIMDHDDIAMVVATGGKSVVKAALSSGKKAIAAGPGNPPAIIDETADIPNAARHVISGTSFDNNLLCIGEKALFVIESVANDTIRELTQNGGHLLDTSQREALEAVVIENGESNKEYIGKDAKTILDAAGITAPTNTIAIVVEVPADHSFVINEYLMPILPVVRVKDFDEALNGAVTADGGRGHTAMIHTNNTARITQYTKAMNCTVVVVNAPSFASCGLEGEGFLAMTIAGPTGEGYTRPRTFTRQRRLTLANNLSNHTL
ncbi:aldehyde dehydrogenase EutE [Candidatus Poribacteria bacterium]|nr:aldehyde dehydrogenase EutE [Candidatus Poribacteria bacterium]